MSDAQTTQDQTTQDQTARDSTPQDRPIDIGDLLRRGRHRLGMSQMTLALDCGISSRHLSFIETGRARPSRDVALRLADSLRLSAVLRNQLLHAAGLASEADAIAPSPGDMTAAMQAAARYVEAAEPYPAIAIDRSWTLLAGNAAASILLQGGDEGLLRSPVNLLRLWLHPRGLAPRVLNLAEWRGHLIRRFAQQIDRSQDHELRPLLDEMRVYAGPDGTTHDAEVSDLTTRLRIRVDGQAAPLHFMATTTLFGGPDDLRCSQIAIASFLPLDAGTRTALTRIHTAAVC